MSENDPYGSEGGAPNARPYPYATAKRDIEGGALYLCHSLSSEFLQPAADRWTSTCQVPIGRTKAFSSILISDCLVADSCPGPDRIAPKIKGHGNLQLT